MWRRTRLLVVPTGMPVIDLIGRLGAYDVVIVDVDDTLVPDQAAGPVLAARTAEAQAAASRSGIGRLVVVSNGSRDRAAGVEGVVWRVNKPWTRKSRLGIGRNDLVAVVGDRALPDGLLARRWGADFYLTSHFTPRTERSTRSGGLGVKLRRLVFRVEPLD